MSSKTLVWRPDRDSQEAAPRRRRRAARRPSPYRRRRRKPPLRQKRQRPLSPEKLAQIRAEGYGRSYVQKQIRRKTPMVFELYDETVKGVIVRRLTYGLDLLVDGQIRRIEKIDIKYMYKQAQAHRIVPFIQSDEALKAQRLVSIVRRADRYQVDNDLLARCHKEKTPVTLTLRSGDIITGQIDWFSQYEIKVNLASGKGVVVFRHGLHRFECAQP